MTADPYRYFRIEAREILEGIGQGLLELEKGSSKDVVARLLRLSHTLKGAARVVKQKDIADLAHALEDALQPLREDAAPVTREIIDGLLGMSDSIARKVHALAPAEASRAAAAESAPHEEPPRMPRADMGEMDAFLEGAAELGTELASLRRGTTSLERARRLAEILHQRLGLRVSDAGGGVTAKLRPISEELFTLLGTLSRDVAQGIERLEREIGQVVEAAERLRLVPAGTMLNSLERAARDAGASLGRRVDFEAIGGEVRVDPDLLSAVQGALVQAVRNAVAHGIEPEQERHAAAKPPNGKISIEITRLGSRIRFACRDDGRGVDFEAVRRALERRDTPATQARTLDERSLLERLLQGGITTSGAVTTVSGRGVGLDVVRETAERLGGEARLSSEPGRGTLLEIVVPISRSALDALLVEANGQVAAIPLDSVRRALRVLPREITRTAEGDSILLDGTVVPFVPLVRSLGVSERARGDSRAWSVVLVQSDRTLAAVGVDRLLGTEAVVARPLPEGMPSHSAVAGALLDADGNPRLLLDPDGLVAAASSPSPHPTAETSPPAPILVIDDSLTTRMLEQSILESAGYEVDLAVSGEDGLDKARQRRYALFLVDVEMPGIDGFTFVERTRADADQRHVPAILVTSRSSDEDRRRGEAAGASAFIVKGEFDQAELLARIRKLVS